MRIDGTNSVITTRDVSFCAFQSNPVAVQLLPNDQSPTPDAVVTEPANANEIAARLNTPVRNENAEINAANAAIEREVPALITEPANATEVINAIKIKGHSHLSGWS